MTSKTTSRPRSEITGVEDPSSKKEEKDSRKSASLNTVMGERLVQYDAVIKGCRELFDLKNTQYKDSIARTGVIGSAVAIAGLSARLESLVISAADAGKGQEEAVIDVVKDIINYGVITGIMIMDDNWKP